MKSLCLYILGLSSVKEKLPSISFEAELSSVFKSVLELKAFILFIFLTSSSIVNPKLKIFYNLL